MAAALGAGGVVVGGDGAAEGHVQVGVHVDAAGHDEQACRIDDVCGHAASMSAADLADLLAFDQHIGLLLSHRR